MLIWAAVIAWAATIVFPFIWGYTFHSKIYKKCLIKYDNMKKIQDATSDKDKEHVPVYQENILVCEEKLYGYFHWFYSVAFLIIAVVWPIAIHLMQKIPSTSHRYNWFWYASFYSGSSPSPSSSSSSTSSSSPSWSPSLETPRACARGVATTTTSAWPSPTRKSTNSDYDTHLILSTRPLTQSHAA